MGQLAREVEWPADESGVGLCAVSLDEATRLLGEIDATLGGAPISFDGVSFEGGLLADPSFVSASFDAGDALQACLAAENDEPETQRCPRWDPIANAPSSLADDPLANDASAMGAPPFVRSLLTVW